MEEDLGPFELRMIGGREKLWLRGAKHQRAAGWHDQSDGFFVAEPGVDLMLNVTKSLRVGMGVSYRYVDGIESRGLSDSDMSGPSANFTLKFGKF